MRDPELLVFDSSVLLAAAAARRWVEIATDSVRRRGRFLVALAGGSTPRSLYTLLAELPYREALPWAATQVFWGDERCVAP
jgi:6-phosphogluconolactonase